MVLQPTTPSRRCNTPVWTPRALLVVVVVALAATAASTVVGPNMVAAFSQPTTAPWRRRRRSLRPKSWSPPGCGRPNDGIGECHDARGKGATLLEATPSGSDNNNFGELTSALARLDEQWQIEQRGNSDGNKPKWTKLMIPNEDDEDYDDNNNNNNNNDFSTAAKNDDFVWMLEPPNQSIPSCVVVFTGGAGLGQFPQVAYNEFLTGISVKLNAVCLTAPYEVGLDHFALAKQNGERLRKAMLVLNDKEETSNDGDRQLPVYSLAHSLGCKLQTIYLAATGLESSFAGVGFVAYNNFSFARTISMARSFAQELRGGGTGGGTSSNPGQDEVLQSIFDFAEMAVGAIGVEFSPTPGDTDRLIQLRYGEKLQEKTRVFVFGSDSLDSSEDFRRACASFESGDNDDSSNNNPRVSNLDGGHLTPVFFKWNSDDLAEEAMGGFGTAGVSQENINMAREAMGGFQGASFGDEPSFLALVDEVCDWILGKPPSNRTGGSTSGRILPGPSSSSDGSGRA